MNDVKETPKPRYTENGVIRIDEKTGHDHECTISESSILDEMKRVIPAGIETCENGLLQDVFNRMAGIHNEATQGTPIDYTTYTDAQLVEAYRDYQLKGEYPNMRPVNSGGEFMDSVIDAVDSKTGQAFKATVTEVSILPDLKNIIAGLTVCPSGVYSSVLGLIYTERKASGNDADIAPDEYSDLQLIEYYRALQVESDLDN